MFYLGANRAIVAIFGIVVLVSNQSLSAQQFEKEIILDGLDRPTGITVDLYGNLYYTEVPSPGQAGTNNQVVRYNLHKQKTKVISVGEPYPTNLAVDLRGNVYWSCQTAGVILRSTQFGNGSPTMARSGLDTPVGLDVPLLFGRALFYTEVPTPGVAGGENEVVVSIRLFGQVFTSVLSAGEPEPADVAVSQGGTVYWTCKTAGVILMRDPAGSISLVKDGLDSPIGLDIDIQGRLYWTEVPTPGVSGENGGKNRVVRYNPRDDELVVISEGEPEPVDVTTDLFGHNVYWTCRTAGVIIKANERN